MDPSMLRFEATCTCGINHAQGHIVAATAEPHLQASDQAPFLEPTPAARHHYKRSLQISRALPPPDKIPKLFQFS